MPARFFMPPESSAGRWCSKPPRPTRRSLLRTTSSIVGARELGPGLERQRHVLGQRHRAEQRAGLEQHAAARARRVPTRGRLAVDADLAAHRLVEADHVAHQRRLAAAAAAQDHEDLPAHDLEVEVLEQHAVVEADRERPTLVMCDVRGPPGMEQHREGRVDDDQEEQRASPPPRSSRGPRPRRRRASAGPTAGDQRDRERERDRLHQPRARRTRRRARSCVSAAPRR